LYFFKVVLIEVIFDLRILYKNNYFFLSCRLKYDFLSLIFFNFFIEVVRPNTILVVLHFLSFNYTSNYILTIQVVYIHFTTLHDVDVVKINDV